MPPRTIRRIVIAVFVAGIAGMIAGSIADNNGAAITFGLITAVAAVGLILVSAVAPSGAAESEVAFDDAAAAEIEARIGRLVAAGGDEATIRDLVRDAVRLGRSSR